MLDCHASEVQLEKHRVLSKASVVGGLPYKDECLTSILSELQLDLALGDDVRVASKEGSIEYHKASVVGGNITTMDVVYEDLTGVRESIDRRSRRLWRGTLNDDGWEVRLWPARCPLFCTAQSRHYSP